MRGWGRFSIGELWKLSFIMGCILSLSLFFFRRRS